MPYSPNIGIASFPRLSIGGCGDCRRTDDAYPASVKKPTDTGHLIMTIKLLNIMAYSARKGLCHSAVGVRVRTTVSQKVLSFPPEVHVKRIRMCRPKPRCRRS